MALASEQQDVSEQQVESVLSQEQVAAELSIFTSAMMVDLSSHIDGCRCEKIMPHIEECQYDLAPKGMRSPHARTSHRG